MAEITKVTTPMVPRENLGNRHKPLSDQAFELNDPSKVLRSGQDGKIHDQNRQGASLGEQLGREMFAPALRSVDELVHVFQKLTMMLQMGIATSEIAESQQIKELMESLFLKPEQLAEALIQQDKASVLFKGEVFDMLRDLLGKFPDNQKVNTAVTTLVKAFEHNTNAEYSVQTILLTCKNLLEYMFSGDKAQFSQYLDGLEEMLLPSAAQTQAQAQAQTVDEDGVEQLPNEPPKDQPQSSIGLQGRSLGVEQKEAAQILKGNLLPLLGEIVVKYNQNERIRDMVMVVVHNIVRVDQGTPEALQNALAKLVNELQQVANLPENFQANLQKAVEQAMHQAKSANNDTLSQLATVLSETLSSPEANAATVRQAEAMLMSMLQNQSSVMNILHFVLPNETPQGKMFAEVYVDPDSEEKVGRSQDKSRKIFLTFDAESIGAFELSFVESGGRVDFSMWCPEVLVPALNKAKRQISELMQVHGYNMNSYHVAERVEAQSVADVFPRLLKRRSGVDVRI